MTAEVFSAWLASHNLTTSHAAELLGVSKAMIEIYKREGAPQAIADECAEISKEIAISRLPPEPQMRHT